MVNQELIGYIQEQLKQGSTQEQVKESLLANGWEEKDVNETLSFLAETDTTGSLQKPKKGKKKIVGVLAILAVFLFLTTGALGYYYYFLTPERVLLKMAMNLPDVKTFEYSGDIELVAETEQVLGESTYLFEEASVLGDTTTTDGVSNSSFTFFGKSDVTDKQQPKALFSFDISSDLLGEGMSLNIGLELRIIQQKLYLKLSNMSELLSIFGLEYLDEQWIVVDPESLGEDVELEISSDEESPYDMVELLTEKPGVFKITEQFPAEDVDGVSSYHYAFELDKTLLIEYMEEKSPDDSTDIRESFESLELLTGEIWVGKDEYYPTKLTLYVKGSDSESSTGIETGIEEVKLTLFLKNFNKPVEIDVPADSVPIEEILNQFQGLLMGGE
jgi:hypothetical protein